MGARVVVHGAVDFALPHVFCIYLILNDNVQQNGELLLSPKLAVQLHRKIVIIEHVCMRNIRQQTTVSFVMGCVIRCNQIYVT